MLNNFLSNLIHQFTLSCNNRASRIRYSCFQAEYRVASIVRYIAVLNMYIKKKNERHICVIRARVCSLLFANREIDRVIRGRTLLRLAALFPRNKHCSLVRVLSSLAALCKLYSQVPVSAKSLNSES